MAGASAGSGGASAGSGGASAGSAGTPTSAGAAGQGGAPEPTPVEQCNTYCEGLQYRLPAALCEDWNGPGWEPEFCGVDSTSCADYCDTLYETVSPECALTLPPVIRCVAPTYADSGLPIEACWLRDCRHHLYTMTSACYGLREKLVAARALWAASGIGDYRLSYGADGEQVEVLVRAGSEPTVTPPGAFAWTVAALFDEVERYLSEPGVAPDATYDQQLGYVVQLRRQEGCDPWPQAVSGVEVEPL